MDYLSQTRLIKSGFLIIPLSKLDFCWLMVWHYMIYPKSIIPHMEKIIGWGQISQSAGFVFLSQIAVHNNVKKKRRRKSRERSQALFWGLALWKRLILYTKVNKMYISILRSI